MRDGAGENGSTSIGPRAIAIGSGLFVVGFAVFAGAVDVASQTFHLNLPFAPIVAGPADVETNPPGAEPPMPRTSPLADASPLAAVSPLPGASPLPAIPRPGSALPSPTRLTVQNRGPSVDRRGVAAPAANASPCPKPGNVAAVHAAAGRALVPAHAKPPPNHSAPSRTQLPLPTAVPAPLALGHRSLPPRAHPQAAAHQPAGSAAAPTGSANHLAHVPATPALGRPQTHRTPVPLLVNRPVSGLLVPVSTSALFHGNDHLDPRAGSRQPLVVEPGAGATPPADASIPQKR